MKGLQKKRLSAELGRKLERRPTMEALKQEGVMHASAASHELAMKLQKRPTVEDLQERGIIHDAFVSPALASIKDQLEKNAKAAEKH